MYVIGHGVYVLGVYVRTMHQRASEGVSPAVSRTVRSPFPSLHQTDPRRRYIRLTTPVVEIYIILAVQSNAADLAGIIPTFAAVIRFDFVADTKSFIRSSLQESRVVLRKSCVVRVELCGRVVVRKGSTSG